MVQPTPAPHPGLAFPLLATTARLRGLILLTVLGAAAAGCGGGTKMLTKAELLDPATCQTCHPQQFDDWSTSMHAYASDDPVFQAMNKRGQRETANALGDFCVKCHAPVALREGLTTDGTNLATLPAAVKGVTCYFCHSVASVSAAEPHNNPLQLASDGTLFGPFADPVEGTPHKSTYASVFDFTHMDSSVACGSCHDIVNQHGAPVERTYQEWLSTLFVDTKIGQTCVRCHMDQSQGRASSKSPNKIRSLGAHALPGVDVALVDSPTTTVQKQQVQAQLDRTLSASLCLTDDLKIEVSVDNVGAGHSFPSGATPDRRVWAEVRATLGDQVVLESGVVPAGQTVETIDDPNLWLIRDCLYDQAQAPVHMFWEAATLTNNQILGPVKATVADPSSFTRAHARYLYPASSDVLSARPDRITLKINIKAIGDDVIGDLVASGDLDPGYQAAIPPITLGPTLLEWTPEKARAPVDAQTKMPVSGLTCVTSSPQYFKLDTVAVSHARCPAP